MTFPLIGRLGYPIVINPSRVFALTQLGPYIEQYRQAWLRLAIRGAPGGPQRYRYMWPKRQGAPTANPRRARWRPCTAWASACARRASRPGTTGNWNAQAERVQHMSYDDWLRDKVVYGTPDTVVPRLQQLRDDWV